MTSLFDAGRAHIQTALSDESCPGATLVVQSKKLDRPRLIAWAINECAQEPNSLEDGESFCAMYVASSQDLHQLVRRHLRHERLRQNRSILTEMTLTRAGSAPPALMEMNYVVPRAIMRVADKLEPDSVELLVLDERSKDEMDPLQALVARVNPLCTLVLTSHEPSDTWPWRYLGSPLVLRGEPSVKAEAETDAAPTPAQS